MPVIAFRPRDGMGYLKASLRHGADRLVDSWKTVLPTSFENRELDEEDWIENAVRLHEAVKRHPDKVGIVGKDDRIVLLNGKTVDDGTPIIFLGTWLRREDNSPLGGRYPVPTNTREDIRKANFYAGTRTFREFAGRDIRLCGLNADGNDDIMDVLSEMSHKHNRLVAKVNRPKYSISFLDFPKPMSPTEMSGWLSQEHEDLGWATVHLEGEADAFIIQENIDIHHEYRIIVIDGVPVAGAGCIERFTPLDNEGTWDTKTEYQRSDGNVARSPDIVERYREFAGRVAEAMLSETELRSYTLDVGIDAEGEPIVIEFNALQNYGLYAMDFGAVLDAEVAMFENDIRNTPPRTTP